MGVDRSEIPQDIIELISKRLTIYVDYLRFRCVCRSWNSSVPKAPLHLPPQLPWLMISHDSFFDLSTNKIHRLNLPMPSGPTRICGSSHGWLVILKETYELSLLNHLTCATLSLPSLNTYQVLVAKVFNDNDDNLIKVVLSFSSSLSDGFTAFAILNGRDFVFCKKGYDSWVRLNHASQNNHWWIDFVYKNGSFFATCKIGTIAVCDIQDPGIFFVEVPENTLVDDICVFVGEDMLLIKQFNHTVSTVTKFEIFKMNWNLLEWEEIQTLGEYSLFIGKNSSLCFSAAD